MNRRQYLASACSVSLAVATAGCSLGGDGQPSETAVVDLREESPGAALPPDITATDAPEIEIYATEFNRVNENEAVVEGGVRNTSDRPFSYLDLEVELFDANEDQDNLVDNATQEGEFEYLAPDQTWTFTIPFDELRIGTVSYTVITATATLAEATPTG